MTKKIVVLILLFSILVLYFYKNQNKEKISETDIKEKTYTSNIIENVKYSSRDINGNEYLINATEGEIDINNQNIIFLKSKCQRASPRPFS